MASAARELTRALLLARPRLAALSLRPSTKGIAIGGVSDIMFLKDPLLCEG